MSRMLIQDIVFLSLAGLTTIGLVFWCLSLYQFFKNRLTNLMLIIPIFTVLLPSVIGYPLRVPLFLIPSHWFYLILFLISTVIVIMDFFKNSK